MRLTIKACVVKKRADYISNEDVDKLVAGVKYLCACGIHKTDVSFETAKKNLDRQIARILREVGDSEGWTFTTVTFTKEQLEAVKELAKVDKYWPVYFGYAEAMDELSEVEAKLPEGVAAILRSIEVTPFDFESEEEE